MRPSSGRTQKHALQPIRLVCKRSGLGYAAPTAPIQHSLRTPPRRSSLICHMTCVARFLHSLRTLWTECSRLDSASPCAGDLRLYEGVQFGLTWRRYCVILRLPSLLPGVRHLLKIQSEVLCRALLSVRLVRTWAAGALWVDPYHVLPFDAQNPGSLFAGFGLDSLSLIACRRSTGRCHQIQCHRAEGCCGNS